MDIHFIEKENQLVRKDKTSQNWESGNWKISKETANKLIGGNIYLHKLQESPSYFGGKITGYKEILDGQRKGRIVFQFTATIEHKGLKTARSGWSMEKKIVI